MFLFYDGLGGMILYITDIYYLGYIYFDYWMDRITNDHRKIHIYTVTAITTTTTIPRRRQQLNFEILFFLA